MAKTDPDTVLLHGDRDHIKSGTAGGDVTPGHLLIRASDGDFEAGGSADTVAGGPFFAVEHAKTGMGIDDDYADGEYMEYYPARPGDEVYAFLATANDVDEGDVLASDGSGGLQAPAAGEEAHSYAVALEALNNTSGSQSRIKVEVL